MRFDQFRVVARHPELWVTVLRQGWRMAPTGWWRRFPYLPVPDPAYLRFRLLTQYGDAAHHPEPTDVVNYLRWCRAWERTSGH